MPEFRYIKNGETLSIQAKTCTGCGACLEVCPHGVLTIRSGVATIRDRALCMECGACARNCPVAAISVTAGVGCAAAIIIGKLTGSAPSCDCGSGTACCG
ncbi:MAG: mercury methylation ferredoxin HgcB [Rectinemataceae bacterium]